MKIDLHSHIFPAPYMKELARSPRAMAEFAGDGIPITVWESAEARIAALQEVGIDFQVLTLPAPACSEDKELGLALAQIANDFIAEVCAKNPTKFAGFASIPLEDVSVAIRELDRAVKKLGLKGVCLGTNIGGKALDAEEFQPFFAEMNRLELPLALHPASPGWLKTTPDYLLKPLLGYLVETTLAATRLVFSGTIERFQNITLILPHLGGTIPFVFNRLDDGYKGFPRIREDMPELPGEYFRKFYYDTATSFDSSSFMCTYNFVGAEHIVFGSDVPFARQRLIAKRISDVASLDLPEESRENIFYRNAWKILKLSPLASGNPEKVG